MDLRLARIERAEIDLQRGVVRCADRFNNTSEQLARMAEPLFACEIAQLAPRGKRAGGGCGLWMGVNASGRSGLRSAEG